MLRSPVGVPDQRATENRAGSATLASKKCCAARTSLVWRCLPATFEAAALSWAIKRWPWTDGLAKTLHGEPPGLPIRSTDPGEKSFFGAIALEGIPTRPTVATSGRPSGYDAIDFPRGPGGELHSLALFALRLHQGRDPAAGSLSSILDLRSSILTARPVPGPFAARPCRRSEA